MELIFVRHGQSQGNRDRVFGGHGPTPLTPLGHLQAEAAARALLEGGRPIAAIYASDLLRTVDTAMPLARATSLEPILAPPLRERDVGDFTGLTFEDVERGWPEGYRHLVARDPDYRPPGGESHRDCRTRVGAWLDQTLARHAAIDTAASAPARIVFFSHGVAINHLLRHILDLDPGANRTYFQVDNCSLHRIEHRGDGAFRVLAINETGHLAEAARELGAGILNE